MSERWIRFVSPALDDAHVEILDIDGSDTLNQLFEIRVKLGVTATAFTADWQAVLEAPATLVFEHDGVVVGEVHGIVASLSHERTTHLDRGTVNLEVVPRAWLMTQRRGNEIFVGRTYPEILASKLEAIGLERDADFVFALHDIHGIREYVTQYEETDYAFFSRLCEHLGIAMFFEHRNGRDVLVLCDDDSLFQSVGSTRLHVRPRREHPAAYAVQTTVSRIPRDTRVHDYNYRAPRLALNEHEALAKPLTQGAWVEYGAHTKAPHETEAIALVRAQELAARQTVVRGTATDLGLRAGKRVTLVHEDGSEQTLLLTRVAFHAFRHERSEGDDKPWDVDFEGMPAELPYRPARVTPRPRAPGLVNAIVDGAINGPYAELDEWGRYHLRFLFDRSGRTDLLATHPVRMMQPHAGANYGMHFPLRPGTEVLVGFVDGDPDRPLIVGTAPNPETASPVFTANYTQNVLRTGSNNELVIEDEIGQERIRLHTPQNNTTLQLGVEEEPEVGALTITEAHISTASRQSNNQVTARSTLLADSSTSSVGNTAVMVAGIEGIAEAVQRGIERPQAIQPDVLRRALDGLALPPDELAELREDTPSPKPVEEEVTATGLWSATANAVATMTEEAALAATRTMAEAADQSLDDAIGRHQGEPNGAPITPAAVVAGERTAALVSRDTTLVYGDRVATLGSFDTASVVGQKAVQLKSPGHAEVAAAEGIQMSTAARFDVAGAQLQFVGGYYPEAEPPPLADGTSVGIMSRHDLHVLSVEDCILVCAKKNLIGTAHDGDVRITAGGTVAVKGATITGSAGSITFESGGEVKIKAGDMITIDGADVLIKGDTVVISASLLYVDAPESVFTGDVKVSGTVTAADFKCG